VLLWLYLTFDVGYFVVCFLQKKSKKLKDKEVQDAIDALDYDDAVPETPGELLKIGQVTARRNAVGLCLQLGISRKQINRYTCLCSYRGTKKKNSEKKTKKEKMAR